MTRASPVSLTKQVKRSFIDEQKRKIEISGSEFENKSF